MGDKMVSSNSSNGGILPEGPQNRLTILSPEQLLEGISKPLGMYLVLMKTQQEISKVFIQHLNDTGHLNAVNIFREKYYGPETKKCAETIIRFLQNVDFLHEMDMKSFMILLLRAFHFEYKFEFTTSMIFPILNTLFKNVYESHPSNVTGYLVRIMEDMEMKINRGIVTYEQIDLEFYDAPSMQ